MQKILSKVLISIGGLLAIVGLFFNFLKWNDIFQGIIFGPIIIVIGIILLLYTKKSPSPPRL